MLFQKNSDEESRSDSRSSSRLDLKKFFKPTIFKRQSSSVNTHHHHVDTLDDILMNKFQSKLGPLLGSGAGGSVRLLDSVQKTEQLLAIKQFRSKQNSEQLKEYIKKCEIEFSTGLNLHHENIIETKDFFHLNNDYYEVMEYCEYDFFAIVMKSNLKRFEINCYFKQICSGVKYLHEYGIAHRDLKLDNCVVNTHGILKLVDFGSCVKFKSPQDDCNKSYQVEKEVVGSGPYMAPEMFDENNKSDLCDPRLMDIWSIAIIYCCMTIKKFPWKTPQQSDQSFQLYSLPDEKPHDYLKAAKLHAELLQQKRHNQQQQQQHKLNESLQNLSVNEIDNVPVTNVVTDNPPDASEIPTGTVPPSEIPTETGIPIATEGAIERAVEKAKTERAKLDAELAKEESATPEKESSPAPEVKESSPALEEEKAKKNNEMIKKIEEKSKHEHRHHHHHSEQTVPTSKTTSHDSDPNNQTNHKHYPSCKIQGPYRLMRILPHSARPIISEMLKINPDERANFDNIFNDEWFNQIEQCTKEHKALHHQHQFVQKEMAHMIDYKS